MAPDMGPGTLPDGSQDPPGGVPGTHLGGSQDPPGGALGPVWEGPRTLPEVSLGPVRRVLGTPWLYPITPWNTSWPASSAAGQLVW